MSPRAYRYRFVDTVSLEDIDACLSVAIDSLEHLHGESKTRLEARHWFDRGNRVCVIGCESPVGIDFNRLFVGGVRRLCGEDSFNVERVDTAPDDGPRPTHA